MAQSSETIPIIQPQREMGRQHLDDHIGHGRLRRHGRSRTGSDRRRNVDGRSRHRQQRQPPERRPDERWCTKGFLFSSTNDNARYFHTVQRRNLFRNGSTTTSAWRSSTLTTSPNLNRTKITATRTTRVGASAGAEAAAGAGAPAARAAAPKASGRRAAAETTRPVRAARMTQVTVQSLSVAEER